MTMADDDILEAIPNFDISNVTAQNDIPEGIVDDHTERKLTADHKTQQVLTDSKDRRVLTI